MSNNLEYEINKELAECYLFMNDLNKAEGYYKKAYEANDTFASSILGLATIAVQRGDLDDAMTLYKKAYVLEVSDKALAGQGLVAMELGNDTEAFDYFCEALGLNAANVIALNCLVREAYALARVDEAIPFLERAVKADPEKMDLRITLAGCLMSVGSVTEAKAHLEFVLNVNPDADVAKDLYEHLAA